MLRNCLQSEISVHVNFRKCSNSAQNPYSMSSHLTLNGDIFCSTYEFLIYSMDNFLFWHKKMDYSFTQSTDVPKKPSTVSKWKK